MLIKCSLLFSVFSPVKPAHSSYDYICNTVKSELNLDLLLLTGIMMCSLVVQHIVL